MTGSLPTISPEAAIRDFLAHLARPARLLLAVSGGSDSVGLLLALHEAVRADPQGGVDLCVATVDHGLRTESAKEAGGVARLCADLGLAHRIRRWDDGKPSSGLSAAARHARYRLLCEVAESCGAQAILVGHTIDDQRETVAMRRARTSDGANEEDGYLGLAGMAEAALLQRRYWLLRPFLAVRREDIRDFLRSRERGWVEDPSNVDERYERVRFRQRLGGVTDAELLTADAASRAVAVRRQALSEAAARMAEAHLTMRHGVLAFLSNVALAGEAETLLHLLSLTAAVLGGRAHALPIPMMERVMAFLRRAEPGRITAGRVMFDLRRDGLYMLRESRNLPVRTCTPGEVIEWDGRFSLTNHTAGEIVIGPRAADREAAATLFAGVPMSIALRAMAVMPAISAAKDGVRRHDMRPMIGPFDRILSQFDLATGGKLAALVESAPFPPLPIKLSARKS